MCISVILTLVRNVNVFCSYNWPTSKTWKCRSGIEFSTFFVAKLVMLRRKILLVSCMKLGKGQFIILAAHVLICLLLKVYLRSWFSSAYSCPWDVGCPQLRKDQKCPQPSLSAGCLLILTAFEKFSPRFLQEFQSHKWVSMHLWPVVRRNRHQNYNCPFVS